MTRIKRNMLIIVIAAVVIAAGAIGISAATAPYALTRDGEKVKEPYRVCIDGKSVAMVATEEEGNQLIEDIKSYYTKDGGEIKSCEVKEELTVQKVNLKRGSNHPTLDVAADKLDYIMSGVEEKTTYEVKDGDTGWSIAAKLDIPFEKLEKWNDGKNLDKLQIGDQLKTYETNALVHVTTTETVTYTSKTNYKTEYIDSSELYEGETKIKKEGKFGKKEITADITKVNGKITDKDIISQKVLKEPVTQVVYRGTKARGTSVVEYAFQFLGNPYVYGGSSLTNGTDCSGFTMAVYAHFGYALPHNSWAQLGSGRAVSYSEAQPGDLIIYGDHVALYAGGGRIIHASSPSTGIITGSATYRHIVGVRRIMN